MELLKKRSYPVFASLAALLIVLSAFLVTTRDAAASGTSLGIAITPLNPFTAQPALIVEQDNPAPLTLDDCYTMMATLAITGTAALVTEVDAAGATTVSCGGIMTVEPPPAAPVDEPAPEPVAESAAVTATAPITENTPITESAPISATAPITESAPVTETVPVTETAPLTATATITPAPGSYADTAPTVRTIPGHGVPGQSWATLNPGYKQPTNLPVRGFSTYYNPGIMEEVVRYRMRVGDITSCPECIGEVALIRAGDINRRVWLQLDDSTVEGPFLVTDCAHTWDVAPLVGRGWGVDLDYATAKRWNFEMRMVTILDQPPAAWQQDAAIAAATGAILPGGEITETATTTNTTALAQAPRTQTQP